jgi:hypothetical protein
MSKTKEKISISAFLGEKGAEADYSVLGKYLYLFLGCI